MSAFEFFFSFYGMVLGLSVAVIATGFATAIQHRKSIRIGWLTLLLALFVALDIATFWDSAWHTFRDAPFSYGMLVIGLAIALVYFIAASLVFPHSIHDGMDLDDHFWANKKVALLLTVAANVLMAGTTAMQLLGKPNAVGIIGAYAFTLTLYVVLVVPAALTKNRKLFGGLIGFHVVIYLVLACLPGTPEAPDTTTLPAAASPGG